RIHYGVDARVRANSLDRHRTESVQVGSETGRRDVREIIAVDRLRKLGLLCAGHRQVNHLVHVVSLFPSGASHYRMLMTVCVTVSAVEIICAFAWKFRCDVIICTSCAVRSTFDASSAPDWMLPNDAVPASPSKTSPDAKDSPQAVSPTCCKPCGLAKLASASLPRAVDWPFVKRAKTMPSPSTLTPVSRPVVKPSCDREFTPNALPNCVVEAKSIAMLMSAAPVVGVWASSGIRPPAGDWRLPSSLNTTCVEPVTGVPSISTSVFHVLTAASLMK